MWEVMPQSRLGRLKDLREIHNEGMTPRLRTGKIIPKLIARKYATTPVARMSGPIYSVLKTNSRAISSNFAQLT